MSGVYVKGMAMPESCRKCKLMMNCDECEGWKCYCLPLSKTIGYLEKFRDEPYVLTDKRHEDCPLVPVPDHGRLIDADAILNSKGVGTQIAGWGKMYHETVIEYAPTIIPADPADKEAGE